MLDDFFDSLRPLKSGDFGFFAIEYEDEDSLPEQKTDGSDKTANIADQAIGLAHTKEEQRVRETINLVMAGIKERERALAAMGDEGSVYGRHVGKLDRQHTNGATIGAQMIADSRITGQVGRLAIAPMTDQALAREDLGAWDLAIARIDMSDLLPDEVCVGSNLSESSYSRSVDSSRYVHPGLRGTSALDDDEYSYYSSDDAPVEQAGQLQASRVDTNGGPPRGALATSKSSTSSREFIAGSSSEKSVTFASSEKFANGGPAATGLSMTQPAGGYFAHVPAAAVVQSQVQSWSSPFHRWAPSHIPPLTPIQLLPIIMLFDFAVPAHVSGHPKSVITSPLTCANSMPAFPSRRRKPRRSIIITRTTEAPLQRRPWPRPLMRRTRLTKSPTTNQVSQVKSSQVNTMVTRPSNPQLCRSRSRRTPNRRKTTNTIVKRTPPTTMVERIKGACQQPALPILLLNPSRVRVQPTSRIRIATTRPPNIGTFRRVPLWISRRLPPPPRCHHSLLMITVTTTTTAFPRRQHRKMAQTLKPTGQKCASLYKPELTGWILPQRVPSMGALIALSTTVQGPHCGRHASAGM